MNKNIKSVFYNDPEVLSMLEAKDRKELLKTVQDRSQSEIALILKGDKGDPGDTPTDEQLRALITPLIPEPLQGERGERGFPGINGRNGESIIGPRGPKGEDSVSTHTTEIIQKEIEVTKDLVKQIVALMAKLPEKDRLDISSVRNASSFMKDGIKYKIEELMHGGGSSSSSSTIYSDTVSGVINSVNKVFTVPNTIVTPIALWLANSIYQPGVDFTTSGTTITMTVAPDISLAGQSFWLSHT